MPAAVEPPAALLQNGVASPRASVSPTGAFDPSSVRHQELGGYVGLEVTSAPPHAVVTVLDLSDANFVKQGAAGYSNEPVLPGDRILKVHLLRSACPPASLPHQLGRLRVSGCRVAA